MTDPADLPYRVVDAQNYGWYNTSAKPGGMYEADYGFKRNLTARRLADLERGRGPLRPVLPITDADEALLVDALRTAGRRAVATTAAALEVVYHALRESQGGLSNPASADYAARTLIAGREGSWESALLQELVWFGNALNLARPKRHQDNSVQALRERGPSKRVDTTARALLADVFTRWVTDPHRYTEVAETLAAVVSRYADETAGADGWTAIADQWLQPGGLSQVDFSACYRLLYSQSAHFNPDLI